MKVIYNIMYQNLRKKTEKVQQFINLTVINTQTLCDSRTRVEF